MDKLECINGFDAAIVLCDLVKPTIGTRNSVKCVVDDNDSYFICETSRLLTALDIKHPVGQYIVSVCQAFNEKYGYGVKTLLFMVGVFLKIIRNLKEKGIPKDYVLKYIDIIVDQCYVKAEELKIPFQNDNKQEKHVLFPQDPERSKQQMNNNIEMCRTEKANPTSEMWALNHNDMVLGDTSKPWKGSPVMAAWGNESETEVRKPSDVCSRIHEPITDPSKSSGASNGIQKKVTTEHEETEIIYLEMKGACYHGDMDDDLDWLLDDSISNEMLGLSEKPNLDQVNQISDQVDSNFSIEKCESYNFECLDFGRDDIKGNTLSDPTKGEKFQCKNNGKSKDVYKTMKQNDKFHHKNSSFDDPISDDEFADCFEDYKSTENIDELKTSDDEFDECFGENSSTGILKISAEYPLKSTENMAKDNVNSMTVTTEVHKSVKEKISVQSINDLLIGLNSHTGKIKSSQILGNSKHYKTIGSTVMDAKEGALFQNDYENTENVKKDLEDTGSLPQFSTTPSSTPVVNNSHTDTFIIREGNVGEVSSSFVANPGSKNIDHRKPSHKSIDTLLQSLGRSSGKSKASNILCNSRHFKTIDSTVTNLKKKSNQFKSGDDFKSSDFVIENMEENDGIVKLDSTNSDMDLSTELCIGKTKHCLEIVELTENKTVLDEYCDKGGKFAFNREDELTSKQKKIQSSCCLLKSNFANMALGLSHGSEEMMQCILDSTEHQSSMEIDCICIEGPLSRKPVSVQGVVTTVRSDAINSVTCHGDSSLRAVIVNGDLSQSYKHIGHKNPLKSWTLVSEGIQEISSQAKWINSVAEVIDLYNIQCLLVRGLVSPGVIDLCLSKQVVVLDNVKFKVLQRLANHMDVSLVTYITDVIEENVCVVKIVPYSEDWMLKHRCYMTICPMVQGGNIQTVVLCHPSQNGCDLLEQEFNRCYSILQSTLTSGWVLPGYGNTEETMYQFLIDLAFQPSSEIYLPAVYEEVAAGFHSFVQTVRQNAQQCGVGHRDAIDSYKTKLDSWKVAFNTAITISISDLYIVTGFKGIL